MSAPLVNAALRGAIARRLVATASGGWRLPPAGDTEPAVLAWAGGLLLAGWLLLPLALGVGVRAGLLAAGLAPWLASVVVGAVAAAASVALQVSVRVAAARGVPERKCDLEQEDGISGDSAPLTAFLFTCSADGRGHGRPTGALLAAAAAGGVVLGAGSHYLGGDLSFLGGAGAATAGAVFGWLAILTVHWGLLTWVSFLIWPPLSCPSHPACLDYYPPIHDIIKAN